MLMNTNKMKLNSTTLSLLTCMLWLKQERIFNWTEKISSKIQGLILLMCVVLLIYDTYSLALYRIVYINIIS